LGKLEKRTNVMRIIVAGATFFAAAFITAGAAQPAKVTL
jgi:hypothetical protein